MLYRTGDPAWENLALELMLPSIHIYLIPSQKKVRKAERNKHELKQPGLSLLTTPVREEAHYPQGNKQVVAAGEVGQKQGFTCMPRPCDPLGKREPLKHTHSCCKLSGIQADLQDDTGFQFTPKKDAIEGKEAMSSCPGKLQKPSTAVSWTEGLF